jgi:hypothetical protein
MNKKIAIAQLHGQIDAIRMVQATRRFGATFTKWRRDTEVVISQIFSGDEKHIRDFTDISYGNQDLPYLQDTTEEASYQSVYYEGLEHAESIIISFIDEIKRYWKDHGPTTSISPYELLPPEKVTIPWLVKHVPIHIWLTVLGFLLTAFLVGVNSTRISIVREIFYLDKAPTTIQGTTTR